jgi:purine-nucleoside phosphorylase
VDPVRASERLLTLSGVPCVKAATVDAVYQETHPLIESWRKVGAQVINMESAPLYAAAAACGLEALWLGHISDVLGVGWQDWYVDRTKMTAETIERVVEMLRSL